MADDFAAQLEAMEELEAMRHQASEACKQREANSSRGIKTTRAAYQKTMGNLKSDLKKCTTFVKKIRAITPEGLAQSIRDVEVLNLSLYISEIVDAIVESNFKTTDVPLLVKLCIQIHQRYEEFTEPMLNGLREALLEDNEETGKRRRIQLRFLIELFEVGVAHDEEFFLQLLRHLLGKSGKPVSGALKPSRSVSVDVPGLVTFVKYAAEPLLGHVPKKVKALVQAAGSNVEDIPSMGLGIGIVSVKMMRELNQLVNDAAENMSMDLVKAFNEFKKCERKSEKDAVIYGALSDQKQQELQDLRKLYEKLLSAVSSIAECLDLEMPQLKEEKESVDAASSGGLSVWDSSSINVDYGPFGDAESKAFYDDLPDLLVMVPLTTLGLSSEQAASLKEDWQKKKDNAFLQDDGDTLPPGLDNYSAEESNTYTTEDPSSEEPVAMDAVSEGMGEGAPSGAVALRLNILLTEKLPDCNTRQKTDEFSSGFCYCNSKKARKNLVGHLLKIPRGRLELIPYYSRIIASLSRLHNDISPPILDALYGQFMGKFKAKQQFDFESKARTVRYIGELIKFSIAPPIMAFKMFAKFFSDFFNHNVLLCAILLETCGRFLYLLPYTHERIEQILDTILRLRRAKNLDNNQQMALESAYFTVKPPERKERIKKKELTRIQQYIRFLFSTKLVPTAGAVDRVIRELRKLPWSDSAEQVEHHVIKACLRVVKTKYTQIPLAADAIAGLVRYHPKLQIGLLDTIIEEFYRGMDTPHKREPQRLLGLARLLGECYNFAMINSTVVFDFLYLFLNYGHELSIIPSVISDTRVGGDRLEALVMSAKEMAAEDAKDNPGTTASGLRKLASDFLRQYNHSYDMSAPSAIDSPTDLFRAQLVVEILRSCGSYFVRGVLKDRLTRFLLHFQKYLLYKTYLPMHIEFTILELFDELESLAAAVVYKELKDKKPAKGRQAVKPSLQGLAPIFPRFDTLESLQEELVKRYGEGADGAEEGCEEEDDEEEEGRLEPGSDIPPEEPDTENEVNVADDEREKPLVDDKEDSELSEANAALLMAKLRQQEAEDNEFEEAFRAAVLESVSSAQRGDGVPGMGVVSGGIDKMALPAVLPKPKNVFKSTGGNDDCDSDEDGDETRAQKAPSVKFKLLSRDQRGRFETREFAVPKDAAMVTRLEKVSEQQRLEKQKLKEAVLRYEEENQCRGGKVSRAPTGAVPVAYLGGKDVYSGRSNQPYITSSRYQKGEGDSASGTKTLNLDEFLAVSGESEIRRVQSNAKGPSTSKW